MRWATFGHWIGGIFSPSVSDEQVQAQFARLREQSPVPVRAEIGKGFQPCTPFSSLCDFPNEQSLLRPRSLERLVHLSAAKRRACVPET